MNRRKFLLFIGTIFTILGCDPLLEKMKLKNQILSILKEGNKLNLKWDCGGDQVIVYVFLNGKEVDYRDKLSESLNMYIINFLALPDVGEFQMEGSGEIILENQKIFLECESFNLGSAEYNDEYEVIGWSDTNEKDELYSGKREMFK